MGTGVDAAVVAAVAASVATALLAWIGHQLARLRTDVKQFMAEHLWLLATASWAQVSIQTLYDQLGLVPPPAPGPVEGKRAK